MISTAGAATTCAYDPEARVVSVTLSAPGDAAAIRRMGPAIRVNAAACGEATVTNTDLVRVVDLSAGDTSVTISMVAGAFLPGATDEPSYSDEIEFEIDLGSGLGDGVIVEGGNWNNTIVLGTAGINLNAGETAGIDPDVTLSGVEQVVLDGWGGDDLLSAGGGRATGDASTAGVSILGGDGADTLIGGAANDLLEGGAGPDTIDGGDGDDVERGLAGDDVLLQGSSANGADRLEGGGGMDTVRYERAGPVRLSADDVANDGEGEDCSASGPPSGPDCERDNIAPSVDILEPDPGGGGGEEPPTVVNGTAGPDDITCSSPCTVYADAGDDTVTCLAACTVFAGPGNDALRGSAEADVLRGEAGADVLRGGAGADLLDGGTGWDTVDYSARTAPVRVSVGDGSANDGEAGESDEVLGSVEKVIGGAGGDTLSGDSSPELLIGGPGDDLLLGNDGDDELRGGDGNDRLDGGPLDDLLAGEAGDDHEDGGGFNDVFCQTEQVMHGWTGGSKTINDRWRTDAVITVPGSPGPVLDVNARVDIEHPDTKHLLLRLVSPDGTATQLFSNHANGSDLRGTVFDSEAFRNIKVAGDSDLAGRFHPAGSMESFDGQAGEGDWTLQIVDDTAGSVGTLNHFSLQFTFASPSSDGADTLVGSLGTHDVADYTGRIAPVTATLLGGDDDGALGERDNVGGGFGDVEDVFGGVGNDVIVGTDDKNDLRGAQGDDEIRGLGGDDVLFGVLGDDALYGGDGNDTLFGNAGNDLLDGGTGTDWARFVQGPMTVDLTAGTASGEGADTILEVENVLTGNTADTLIGDAARNLLNAGGGDDVVRGMGENDTLIGGGGRDTLDGGTGWDWVNYSGAPSGITVDLAAGTASGGHGIDSLGSIESVKGSPFADAIYGNAVANILEGGAGDDRLYGREGDDKLNGEGGWDELDGGPGTDSCLNGEALSACE